MHQPTPGYTSPNLCPDALIDATFLSRKSLHGAAHAEPASPQYLGLLLVLAAASQVAGQTQVCNNCRIAPAAWSLQ
jgi:hypothetical protein